MAYSTNALNALSTNGGAGDARLDPNHLKASSQHLRKNISQRDSASSITNSLPKGRRSSGSSEDASKPGGGDRISLHQFLDENKAKNADKKSPIAPPTKPLLTLPIASKEQRSPKRSPSSNSEFKPSSSRSSPLKSNYPEGATTPTSTPSSPTKGRPPKLDLSSLQNEPPDSARKSGHSTASPTPSTSSHRPGEKSPGTPLSSKDTMVFVVRSPTDSNKVQVKRQPGGGDDRSYRSSVTLRPRSANPQARPSSMIDKPTGSVSPYSHLAPSQSMRANPRKDNDRGGGGSVIDRLDSLLSNPRGTSTPIQRTLNSNQSNGVTSSPGRSQTPVSGRPAQNPNFMSLPRSRRTPRSPHGGTLTSTPASTRSVDVALVNPLQGVPGNPTRRDVPPDVVPSPIRRDVPPDTNSLRRPPKNGPESSQPPGARRPGTPTKPRQDDNLNDTEKSTLWFEYGCV